MEKIISGVQETLARERERAALTQALGPRLTEALEDPSIIEILINPDSSLWFDRLPGGLTRIGELDPNQTATLAATVATLYNRTFTEETPILEARLPFSSARFTAVRSPITEATTITLRKGGGVFSLDADFVDKGYLTPKLALLLRKAIRDRKNIIVCGGPGAAKTSFANALLQEIDDGSRIFILEDTPELHCSGLHAVNLRSTPRHSLDQLLTTTLRLSPRRICIGELRGPEALTLFAYAWSTGSRGGVATLHANSARAALARLKILILMANPTFEEIARLMIPEAVDLIVSMRRTPAGFEVLEVLQIDGYDKHTSSYQIRTFTP